MVASVSHSLRMPSSSPQPPSRRRRAPEPDEPAGEAAGAASAAAAAPAIVNEGARSLAKRARPENDTPLDVELLYTLITHEFETDPAIVPYVVCERLSSLQELLAKFQTESYRSIKKRFSNYLRGMGLFGSIGPFYMKVVSELCKQSTQTSSYSGIAEDFNRHHERYIASVLQDPFNKTIQQAQVALAQTIDVPKEGLERAIGILRGAGSQISCLQRLDSIAAGRPGDLTRNVIVDSYRDLVKDFDEFRKSLTARRHEHNLSNLGELLRERMILLLEKRQEHIQQKSISPLNILLEYEREAIWKTGYEVIKLAITNSPGRRTHRSKLTEQVVAKIWDDNQDNFVDQRDLIEQWLTSLEPRRLQKIHRQLQAHHGEQDPNALDRRVHILVNAFINSRLTLRSLANPGN